MQDLINKLTAKIEDLQNNIITILEMCDSSFSNNYDYKYHKQKILNNFNPLDIEDDIQEIVEFACEQKCDSCNWVNKCDDCELKRKYGD